MITNKKIFFIGLIIFIIPFLGLPSSWRFTLIILSSLGLMAFSIKIELPTKIKTKPKDIQIDINEPKIEISSKVSRQPKRRQETIGVVDRVVRSKRKSTKNERNIGQ